MIKMESILIEWALSKGEGVLFALLMFWLCTTTIKKNTRAIQELTIYIKENLRR